MAARITTTHARYPFLDGAQEAVSNADIDLIETIRTNDDVVDRATDRITTAVTDGTVGDRHPSTRTELLSYPVARVIVSLLDTPLCTRRYAQAEATRAISYLDTDQHGSGVLKSQRRTTLDYDDLLAELGYGETVSVDGDTGVYLIDLPTYLELISPLSNDRWSLVHQTVFDGTVHIPDDDISVLLSGAIRARVRAGLPLDIPAVLGDELVEPVAEIDQLLHEQDLVREIDTVVPEQFPPCMQALLDSVQSGEHLDHSARFAIATFLASIGMTTDEMVDLFEVSSEFGEKMTRYQVDHIRGETSTTEYDPPTCATMQSYGNCINKDERCEDVINESHPLVYYESALDDAEEDDLTDWRDQRSESDSEPADEDGE